MKVYFHSNGALMDSPHFKYTLSYPPKGIDYVVKKLNGTDVILDMKKQRAFKLIASFGKMILNMIGRSEVNVSGVPENISTINLIHSFNTIPITNKPYIIEMESFHSLFIGGAMDSRSIERIIKLLSKRNCKKILFWTQNAYDNFHILMMSPTLKRKSVVLYPGVPLYVQNKFHKKPTIGFIARDFFSKGGELVLPIMKDFTESGRAKAIIVSDLDLINEKHPELIKQYSEYIDFKPLMPRDKLHKDIFPKIDIMFYPGYSDTFGYMFPEAMSHGIPIITLDGCSRRELVHNEKGGYVVWGKLSKYGFLVASPTDKEIPDVQTAISMVLTNLLSDEKIRKSMGDYNYNLVKNGQFSLYKRNKILQSIYSEATK